jgi:dTMP kinase
LQGLDFDWCKNPDHGLTKPDLTFYIDVPSETIEKRGEFGMERYERSEFQRKVGEAYNKFKELYSNDCHWITINANDRCIEEIHKEITEKVM